MIQDNEGGPDRPSMFRLLASQPEREKGRGRAVATSVVLHGAIFAALIWATLAVGEEIEEDEEEVTFIEVAEEVIPPPPPPPPEPEAPPPVLEEEIPQGFQTLTLPEIIPEEIPPPGEKLEERDFSGQGVEGGEADGAPLPGGTGEPGGVYTFTPYTVKPQCKTHCEPKDILSHIPAMIARSGASCELQVGLRIDTAGQVTATQILKPSGNGGCDRAVEEWAKATTWTTAYNRDQPVVVWIAQPISITTN